MRYIILILDVYRDLMYVSYNDKLKYLDICK